LPSQWQAIPFDSPQLWVLALKASNINQGELLDLLMAGATRRLATRPSQLTLEKISAGSPVEQVSCAAAWRAIAKNTSEIGITLDVCRVAISNAPAYQERIGQLPIGITKRMSHSLSWDLQAMLRA